MASARGKWAIGCSLLLLAGVASAKQWLTCPERGVMVFLGLDDTSAPTQVQDGRAQALQNVLLDISRSLTKRHGIDTIGDTCDIPDEDFPPVTGLYYTQFSSGTERIIRTCSSRFQFLSGSAWTTVPGAAITGGQNNQFVFTTALDNIIGTNDVNPPIQYDGSTLTTVSFSGLTNPITQAKTLAFFKNYLLFFNITEGGTDRPTRFRWSNVGTINTWTQADFLDIGALGGQEINAVAELYDNLYVLLTDSVYKLSLVGGVNTFNVSKVTDDIGCIAKNSVQSIVLTNSQNGLVFLDKDKRIYFFNGVYPQEVSTIITKTMEGLNSSRLQYAVSSDTTTDYWLCLSNTGSGLNNLCLDLQYQIGEWTKHTNVHANAMTQVLDASDEDQTYYGNYHGLTYQLSNDNLRSDIGNFEDTVDAVDTYTTSTASGLQVLYFTGQNLVSGALIGAPLLVIGGTASTATGLVVENTATGLVVYPAISPTPTATTQVEVGGIDAFYTTKWYDVNRPSELKEFGEVYFWADADVTSTVSISYATDYNADLSTQEIALTSSKTDATWGSTTWGVPLWGEVDSVFRNVKLKSQGRFLRIKYADDDPDEIFKLYGFNINYLAGSIN